MSIKQKVDKLGPFACVIFEVVRNTDEFKELATFINFEEIPVGDIFEDYSPELGATIKAHTCNGILWNISITKQADGLLGIAAKI